MRQGLDGHRSSPLFYILAGGLVLLALIGLVLIGAYFYLSRPQPVVVNWSTPVDAVRPTAVAPDLAALSLAGEPDDRVIRAAFDAAEVETANATLAYSVLLPDSTRGGQWLLVAEHYGGSPGDPAVQPSDPARAVLAYRADLDQAALSADLGDVARAGLSLQAARGLAGLGQNASARLALAQAENIARYSLTLLPSQRRDILQQVVAAYRSSGDRETANKLEVQITKASQGPGVKLAPVGDLLGKLRGGITLPADLITAISARQRAAAAMAAGWLSADQGQRDQLAQAVGDALQAEDKARASFYGHYGSLKPEEQLAMLHDRINWLQIKRRVAEKAYGVSLVPEWEGQVEQLRTELSATYTDLINGYGRQLDTLPAADAAAGRLQLLQEALLWTRLGLFPGDAEGMLRAQLIDAAQQLWSRRGGAGLVVVVQEADGQRFYLLSGSRTTPAAGATETAGK